MYVFFFSVPRKFVNYTFQRRNLVAQCSATTASVAATPPCSATLSQRQLEVRHPRQLKGDWCDRAFKGRGCSATPLLHLKKPRILRKSVATRVARQGVPAHVCNYEEEISEPKMCHK